MILWINENQVLFWTLFVCFSFFLGVLTRWYNHYVLYKKGYSQQQVSTIIKDEDHSEFPFIPSIYVVLFWWLLVPFKIMQLIFRLLNWVILKSAKEAAEINTKEHTEHNDIILHSRLDKIKNQ